MSLENTRVPASKDKCSDDSNAETTNNSEETIGSNEDSGDLRLYQDYKSAEKEERGSILLADKTEDYNDDNKATVTTKFLQNSNMSRMIIVPKIVESPLNQVSRRWNFNKLRYLVREKQFSESNIFNEKRCIRCMRLRYI